MVDHDPHRGALAWARRNPDGTLELTVDDQDCHGWIAVTTEALRQMAAAHNDLVRRLAEVDTREAQWQAVVARMAEEIHDLRDQLRLQAAEDASVDEQVDRALEDLAEARR